MTPVTLPPESKREQILENIVAAMREIRRENGFHVDIPWDSVTRSIKDLETILDQELPYLQITVPTETDDTILMPTKDEGDLEIWIEGAVKEFVDVPVATLQERAVRDVRKKLTEDKSRGGIAKYTRVIRVETDAGEHGFEGVRLFRVVALVKYKFDWSTP